MNSEPKPKMTDGRRARRDRGRLAVIEAVIALFQEGSAPPTPQQMTERAGVSSATLFRYFDTLDDLLHEATAAYFDRFGGLFEIPGIGTGTPDERVRRYADSRIALYEEIAPFARYGRARAFDHPHFAATLHRARGRMAEQVRDHFGSELAALAPRRREGFVAAVCTLTSFESWDQLTHDFSCASDDIRTVWRRALTALCDSPS
ncbi:TetR/AcrR family transcriptional regulator [Streptomyces sp. CB02009]|uniref:TetR/AcrR family transcriptional regulator n=1 Tax=Streptomyces sp. CB02009 TaxID=1703938 RepID=UPI000AE6BE7F|nr:TetR/AcrR family transcriptional regulator [Streptomyces sp. CB02009]